MLSPKVGSVLRGGRDATKDLARHQPLRMDHGKGQAKAIATGGLVISRIFATLKDVDTLLNILHTTTIVGHGDLQKVITAVVGGDFDSHTVRDLVISVVSSRFTRVYRIIHKFLDNLAQCIPSLVPFRVGYGGIMGGSSRVLRGISEVQTG
jgi:hypothetical protein